MAPQKAAKTLLGTAGQSSPSRSTRGVGNVRVYPKREANDNEIPSQQQARASNVVPFPKRIPNSALTPSHEVFLDQYSKAGLQPQGLVGANNNPSPEDQERARRQAQKRAEYQEAMEAAAYREEMSQEQQATFAAEKVATVDRLRSQKGNLAGKAATQAAALALNTPTALWMTSWHVWVYLTFQIPLALFDLVFFGMAVLTESSWLTRQFGSLLSLVSLDPLSFFMIVHTALWGLCFLGLIVTMFIYLLRGQSPANGDRATAKVLAILGCLIGYAIPFLNLFPWIGIYIFVMWTSRD